MSKSNSLDNLFNFWQEIKSLVSEVKGLSSDIKVSLIVDGEEYSNIQTIDLRKNRDEVYINLTPKLRLILFKKKDYELYFEKYFDENSGSVFKVANEEFLKMFKFHKEVQLKDLLED